MMDFEHMYFRNGKGPSVCCDVYNKINRGETSLFKFQLNFQHFKATTLGHVLLV